jgi:hypothetical protein
MKIYLVTLLDEDAVPYHGAYTTEALARAALALRVPQTPTPFDEEEISGDFTLDVENGGEYHWNIDEIDVDDPSFIEGGRT